MRVSIYFATGFSHLEGFKIKHILFYVLNIVSVKLPSTHSSPIFWRRTVLNIKHFKPLDIADTEEASQHQCAKLTSVAAC